MPLYYIPPRNDIKFNVNLADMYLFIEYTLYVPILHLKHEHPSVTSQSYHVDLFVMKPTKR